MARLLARAQPARERVLVLQQIEAIPIQPDGAARTRAGAGSPPAGLPWLRRAHATAL
jgi:hypothetical protein